MPGKRRNLDAVAVLTAAYVDCRDSYLALYTLPSFKPSVWWPRDRYFALDQWARHGYATINPKDSLFHRLRGTPEALMWFLQKLESLDETLVSMRYRCEYHRSVPSMEPN